MIDVSLLRAGAAAVLAACVLAPAAVTPAPAAPAAVARAAAAEPIGTDPAPPLGTNGAAVPDLRWAPCADAPGYECTTAEVPLSYREPSGPSITLAVGKLPAADQEHKLGTIFYNPGGPGVSGRIAPALTPALHERFDIVGFDPRGIADSTGLECALEPGEGFGHMGSGFPVTPDQERATI